MPCHGPFSIRKRRRPLGWDDGFSTSCTNCNVAKPRLNRPSGSYSTGASTRRAMSDALDCRNVARPVTNSAQATMPSHQLRKRTAKYANRVAPPPSRSRTASATSASRPVNDWRNSEPIAPPIMHTKTIAQRAVVDMRQCRDHRTSSAVSVANHGTCNAFCRSESHSVRASMAATCCAANRISNSAGAKVMTRGMARSKLRTVNSPLCCQRFASSACRASIFGQSVCASGRSMPKISRSAVM